MSTMRPLSSAPTRRSPAPFASTPNSSFSMFSGVIIGGTSLFGGKGAIWGTFIGVMFMGALLNGMTLWGFNPFWQDVVRGGLILLAVLLNQLIDRKR